MSSTVSVDRGSKRVTRTRSSAPPTATSRDKTSPRSLRSRERWAVTEKQTGEDLGRDQQVAHRMRADWRRRLALALLHFEGPVLPQQLHREGGRIFAKTSTYFFQRRFPSRPDSPKSGSSMSSSKSMASYFKKVGKDIPALPSSPTFPSSSSSLVSPAATQKVKRKRALVSSDDDDDDEDAVHMIRATAPSSASPSSFSSSLSPSLSLSSSTASVKTEKTEKKEKTATPKKAKTDKPTEGTAKSSKDTEKKVKAKSEDKQIIERMSKKVSDDVDVVLGKVYALTKSQQKANKAGAKGQGLTLADMNLDNVFAEVEVLDGDVLRAKIEQIVMQITKSILEGHGFKFVVPSRTSKNQLYIPELDRIVLKDQTTDREFASLKNSKKTAITTRMIQLIYELCLKKIHVTKRDLFYTDVKLFTQQSETDVLLEDVACMLGCTRTSLNVVASEKGIVVGKLSFRDDGDLIDCTKMGTGGKAITPCIDRITDIKSDAKFILLVEKDAAFMRLAEDRFYNTYPCIIITAKGQPDVATRMFLRMLKTELNIPVLGLVDADPYGLKILSVYMSGSKSMSYDSLSLTTPDIKWLGVRPSDLDKYNIPQQCRLEMTESDIRTGKELLEEEFIKKNPVWHEELTLMVNRREKAEIQALSNFGFQYLTKVYLPLKLQQGDWV